MTDNVLTSLNWLDLVLFIVIAGIVFRGATQGFVVEFFKIIGIYLATVLSLHYFAYSAEYLNHLLAMPLKLGAFVCYLIIVIFIILLFRIIAQGWLLILKVEAKAGFNQWGGAIIAFFSSVLICGLLIFGLLLTGSSTLQKFVRQSVAGSYLMDLSPHIYKATYQGFIVPFFPDEKLNQKVFETLQ